MAYKPGFHPVLTIFLLLYNAPMVPGNRGFAGGHHRPQGLTWMTSSVTNTAVPLLTWMSLLVEHMHAFSYST